MFRHLLSAFTATLIIIVSAVSVQAQMMPPSKAQLHAHPPKVPEYVVFAGDTVRFDRSDLYERMDREMIAFTYMQTNSVLMLKRSEKIFSRIVPILKNKGIPEDLKYLMAVESNLNPRAYSSAGAAGLWQFTKATAATYGLEVNAEVDERYNIEKETAAACDFLNDAYKKFGDWLTVAASYNSGQAGTSRRILTQKQDKAIDLWMPEETSRYIFRILVAKLFFLDPESFGFSVSQSEKYKAVAPKRIVTVSESISSLVDFALENGVTYARLKEENLWLRDSKLTNKYRKSYNIMIPEMQ